MAVDESRRYQVERPRLELVKRAKRTQKGQRKQERRLLPGIDWISGRSDSPARVSQGCDKTQTDDEEDYPRRAPQGGQTLRAGYGNSH